MEEFKVWKLTEPLSWEQKDHSWKYGRQPENIDYKTLLVIEPDNTFHLQSSIITYSHYRIDSCTSFD